MLIQNSSDSNRFSETEKEIVHYILQTTVSFILDCLYSFYYHSNYEINKSVSRENERLIQLYASDKNK